MSNKIAGRNRRNYVEHREDIFQNDLAFIRQRRYERILFISRLS